MKVIKFIVYLPIGLVLYFFSKNFRDTVNRKMGPINDTVEGGETVVAVLNSGGGAQVIDASSLPKSWLSRLRSR